MTSKLCNKKYVACNIILFIFAVCLCAVGVAIILLYEQIIHRMLQQQIPLSNGSESYKNWLTPPFPVHMQFWVFHVNNSAEVISGEKPYLIQRGPYTYLEVRKKANISFNKNGTLSSIENKDFIFQPDLSVGNETDRFTTVNLALVVVMQKVNALSLPSWVKTLVSYAIMPFEKDLFVEHSVGEIIWGYEDPLLKAIHDIPLIGKLVDDHVGLFYGKNHTDDGLYTIFTGASTLSKFNQIDMWKGNRSLPFWSTKSANMLNGTDGTAFHPLVKNDDTLFIFSSDICRSIYVTFEKDTSVRGIDVKRFRPPALVFANSSVNPANRGFCVPKCLGAGVVDMHTCQKGMPAILSQPHFYQGADKYIHGVGGLAPTIDHATMLDIEPTTGVPLRVGKKLQININVHKEDGFAITDKLRATFLPIMWLNESATLDEATATLLKRKVVTPLLLLNYGKYVAIGLGGFILLILAVVLMYRSLTLKPRRSDTLPLLAEDLGSPRSSPINSACVT